MPAGLGVAVIVKCVYVCVCVSVSSKTSSYLKKPIILCLKEKEKATHVLVCSALPCFPSFCHLENGKVFAFEYVFLNHKQNWIRIQ